VLSVDPAYRLVHSGDVKIYENLGFLPRAFVVPRANLVADEEAALRILADPHFDPAHQAILIGGDKLNSGNPALIEQEADGELGAAVEIVTYQPERIRLQVAVDVPAYLLLADTYYPGWEARVDGQPVPIRRADLYFRAVALEAGEHEVTFHYRPGNTHLSLYATLAAWLAWFLGCAVISVHTGRSASSSV
jgi:hypothetical protein